jgi:hypothetical protein
VRLEPFRFQHRYFQKLLKIVGALTSLTKFVIWEATHTFTGGTGIVKIIENHLGIVVCIFWRLMQNAIQAAHVDRSLMVIIVLAFTIVSCSGGLIYFIGNLIACYILRRRIIGVIQNAAHVVRVVRRPLKGTIIQTLFPIMDGLVITIVLTRVTGSCCPAPTS